MILNIHSSRLNLLVSALLVLMAAATVHADQNRAGHPHIIEVFTSTDLPITGAATINPDAALSKTELQIYELDGIQRFEAQLSSNLPTDPDQSKHIALQRIQQLDEANRAQMQRAAVGLSKAVQYGVDRYPAAVFDSTAVVYGVTNIHTALLHYQQWREGGNQ